MVPVSRNHPEVIERVVRDHSARLVLYAHQWTNDPDDIVQEAFSRLAASKTFPDDCVAWLYRVVRNLAINAGLKERRRHSRETNWAKDRSKWFEDDVPSPLDPTLVIEVMKHLSEEIREIVVLRVWCDKTFEEIARITNSSASTAYRRYCDGLKILKQQLVEIPRSKGP